jgi:hypothetical protein
MKRSRADRASVNRKAIVGVQKHYATTPTMIVDGVSYETANLVNVLQGPIDAADATTAASAAFHKAVADEKAANDLAARAYAGLKALVVNQFKTSPETLADFGITLPSRRVPDAATTARAVEKSKATRLARHTMGKRQKEKVKGTVPASPSPSAQVAATPVTTPSK